MSLLLHTPLYQSHRALGARMVGFGGWEMPVQYTSILEEHRAVRTAAGLFDISHMGEVFVSGPKALPFLNELLTNNIPKIPVGGAQYNLMCNPQGGVIDDLFVYRLEVERFLLVINASRIERDVTWMREQNRAGATLVDASGVTAALALQGPAAAAIADRLLPGVSQKILRLQIGRQDYMGEELWLARTGYTGEDGFEIILPSGFAGPAWDLILATGADLGLKPCGLGARDTLRLEVCYPLNGSDLSETTTPIEAGLGWAVALDKPAFIGKEILQAQKATGTTRRLMAFQMTEKGAPPRPHYPILADGKKIGEVTSGTLSPTLGIGIGMGYIDSPFAKIGQSIAIEVRGQSLPAVIAAKPLYKKS